MSAAMNASAVAAGHGSHDAHALDVAIDRLQDALEDARAMPQWAAVLVVVIAMLGVIILLHVLALFAAGPCLWIIYTRRKRQAHDRLLADEILDPDAGLELSPTADAVLEEPPPPP